MGRTPPSRINRARILADLRAAARKGDRAALTLAVDQMRTLAFSPRYWERYLTLLGNPLARLVDLLVIRQGDRIAQQKGWRRGPRGSLRTTPVDRLRGQSPRSKRRPRPGQRRRRAAGPEIQQPMLFDL